MQMKTGHQPIVISSRRLECVQIYTAVKCMSVNGIKKQSVFTWDECNGPVLPWF